MIRRSETALDKHNRAEEVNAFITALEHPLKDTVLALRQIILEADPSIAEGIKWKVPSFYTCEYFATFHLRAHDRVGIILHLGAKKRDHPTFVVADPHSLLEWLGPDRARLEFQSSAEINHKRPALTQLIRDWIGQMDPIRTQTDRAIPT
ncbi:DUF1801 domain-containing protein [Deinococcus sp.]|uniref:DUF1801 domain-containing protein n=1 Tax=Deinococcus sp. TaxID=47478 RepID=UPI003CC5B81C